jgi:hypothetical protein
MQMRAHSEESSFSDGSQFAGQERKATPQAKREHTSGDKRFSRQILRCETLENFSKGLVHVEGWRRI